MTRELVESLPVLHRLALSYAPARASRQTLALLALDARLASIVRRSSEPMMAQIRLAWWREQLGQAPGARPRGDPLVDLIGNWGPHAQGLVALVDGWECLVPGAPLDAPAAESFASGRAEAFAALARLLGHAEAAEAAQRMAHGWALRDLHCRLGEREEAELVQALMSGRDWQSGKIPRDLRPLAVLHGLAARSARRDTPLDRVSPMALLSALRLGLFGS